MSYDRQKVVDLAISQIGYHEKASSAQLDDPAANPGDGNWTKYARDLDAMSRFYNGRKNGFAWCDVFVDWCFVQAYGRAAAQRLLCQPDDSAGAGCSFSAQYFNAAGQFHKSSPQPGDQIFFGSSWTNVWHTGLVVETQAGRVVTVEGNSGDMVARRSYSLGDGSIFGYGRPDWGVQPAEPSTDSQQDPDPVSSLDTCTVRLPVLAIGAESEAVRALQYLLRGRGFSVGFWGCDGDFGPQTESALGKYQRDRQIECDGIAGPETWQMLICDKKL